MCTLAHMTAPISPKRYKVIVHSKTFHTHASSCMFTLTLDVHVRNMVRASGM